MAKVAIVTIQDNSLENLPMITKNKNAMKLLMRVEEKYCDIWHEAIITDVFWTEHNTKHFERPQNPKRLFCNGTISVRL